MSYERYKELPQLASRYQNNGDFFNAVEQRRLEMEALAQVCQKIASNRLAERPVPRPSAVKLIVESVIEIDQAPPADLPDC